MYHVEHMSLEVLRSQFKRFGITSGEIPEDIKSIIDKSDNDGICPIDSYDSLEEALKRSKEPYATFRSGGAGTYLLIEYDVLWKDCDDDTLDYLGIYGIDEIEDWGGV